MQTMRILVRGLAAAAVATGALSLGACGDLNQQDLTDLLDQAGKAREQFDEEFGDELDTIFEELQKAAEQQDALEEAATWGTRPEPPPYTPTTQDTVVSDDQAIERSSYPKDSYEDIVAHYADELGVDLEGQGGPGETGTTLDDDEGTYVVVDNSGEDSVNVTVVYHAP